jgi:hypothetical protein
VHVDVEPVAVGAWFVHLLEPHGRSEPVRVDQRAVAVVLVAEDRRPERADAVGVHGVERDLEALRRGGFRGRVGVGSQGRDAPRQLDVAGGQFPDGVGGEAEPDPVGVAHVDVRVVVSRLGRLGDALDQRRCGGERPGAEVRVDGTQQEAPVAAPLEVGELVGGDGGVLHGRSEARQLASVDGSAGDAAGRLEPVLGDRGVEPPGDRDRSVALGGLGGTPPEEEVRVGALVTDEQQHP